VGAFLKLVLLPLSGVWRGVTAVRNARWNRVGGSTVDALTVVSVGNLAVGGTGKTPMTSWVVKVLLASGHRPAILLSGYGKDEELLHRAWTPEAHVISDPDRTGGAKAAAAHGCDVAVLDDGFQHRGLGRQLDLVLLSVEDAFPGPVLPRGPYREPFTALCRADGIILTRRGGSPPQARALAEQVSRRVAGSRASVLASVHLTTESLTSLTGGGEQSRAESGLEGPLAVTAIARPDAFLRDVASLATGRVDLLAYVDHHEFSRQDALDMRRRAGDRSIVITEKDAVKLIEFTDVLGEVWVLREQIVWDWGEAEVRGLLDEVVPSQTLREERA
jgi:tetraacyldisaccharide 4'-kinase